MSTLELERDHAAQVREILLGAGERGASHEDFVEAGLAASYIAALQALVGRDGLEVRTDFTTGSARWILAELA